MAFLNQITIHIWFFNTTDYAGIKRKRKMKPLIFVFASMEATPMIMLYRATFELTTLMVIDRLVGWFMVLNATFNNISAISWRLVLLVEETGVPGETHRPVASHWQTLSHKVASSPPRHERGSNSQTLVVIGTNYTGSWKSNSNYHMITTTTVSLCVGKQVDNVCLQ